MVLVLAEEEEAGAGAGASKKEVFAVGWEETAGVEKNDPVVVLAAG